MKKKFNVYTKNSELVDHKLTADFIKEKYGCENPWRYATKGMLLFGKFMIMEVEE